MQERGVPQPSSILFDWRVVLVVFVPRHLQLLQYHGILVRLLRPFLVLLYERPLLWLFVQRPLDILVHECRMLQRILQDLLWLVEFWSRSEKLSEKHATTPMNQLEAPSSLSRNDKKQLFVALDAVYVYVWPDWDDEGDEHKLFLHVWVPMYVIVLALPLYL